MRWLLTVTAAVVLTSCTSTPVVECDGPRPCDDAAEAALTLLADESEGVPHRLRVADVGNGWFVVACFADGRYLTVEVEDGSDGKATFGGALYGVVPCA